MMDRNVFCHMEQYWSMSSEASASQSVSEIISQAFSKSACMYLQTVHLCWLGWCGWWGLQLIVRWIPLWSELQRGGMVEQLSIWDGEEVNTKSMRDVWPFEETWVSSVTTWDKLKQSARVQNLGYKGWDELLKFALKSPRSMKLVNWGMLKDVIKLDKVSKIELGEFGGWYKKLLYKT